MFHSIMHASVLASYFRLSSTNCTAKVKVNIKYQGLKDVAPIHLLLILENPNGFEMWKLTINCIENKANIIYKHLERYSDPLECK